MSDVQIEVLKWLAIFVFACGTACAMVGAFLVVSALAKTGVDNVLKAVAYASDLPHNFKKLRAIVKEHERLRERNEQLEGRLLYHYDALSDWPLSEEHATDMCRRIEALLPDVFGAAAAKGSES